MKFRRRPHQAEKATAHPLRARRKDKGITQQELADTLGNTRAHISQIEHYRITPGITLALKMKLIFGLPIESWFKPEEIEEMRREVSSLASANYSRHRPARQRAAKVR